MANCNRLGVAVRADASHAWNFGELTACLNEKQSVGAAGNPQPNASRREMRNLRVVQKMHHVMNSGLYLICTVISAAPAGSPAADASGARFGLPGSHEPRALQLYDSLARVQFRIPLAGNRLHQFGSDAT